MVWGWGEAADEQMSYAALEAASRAVLDRLIRRSAELVLETAFVEDGIAEVDPARNPVVRAMLDGHRPLYWQARLGRQRGVAAGRREWDEAHPRGRQIVIAWRDVAGRRLVARDCCD